MTQTVRNMPTLWETRVQSLGREDTLEKGMATHTSILAWRVPWTEEPVGQGGRDLKSMGRCKESDVPEQLTHAYTSKEIEKYKITAGLI